MGTVLQEGRRRERRGFRPLVAVAVLLAAVVAALVLLSGTAGDPPRHAASARAAGDSTAPAPARGHQPAPLPYATLPAPARERVDIRFRIQPRSGLLVDLRTGRVLWSDRPDRVLPIASVTKMMTALLVVTHVPPSGRVLITRQALNFRGSAVGVLPLGRRIDVDTMLNGLLLPSGNDAARALALRVAGTLPDFVRLMNAKARALRLRCTHFTSPDGFEDRGNHSCAADLALLAREVLAQPRLARIVRRRKALLPFPIRTGRLELFNNNPLLLSRYPGTDGVKTGFTDRAGRCLVAAAHRGATRLVVVLLHSPDPGAQAMRLLDAGFRAARRLR